MTIAADRHVVRTTFLEVTSAVRTDAFGFQQEVAAWTHDVLLPELDRIFTSLPDTATLVRIDSLAIELNTSDVGNWGDDVRRKLKSEVLAALIRTRSERVAPDALTAMDEQVPLDRGFLDKLAYYLKTGVLPWPLALTSRSAFEEEMKLWLTSSEIGVLRPQVAALLQSGHVRSRFLASFSPELLRKTLTVLFDVPETVWDRLLPDCVALRLIETQELRTSLENVSAEPVRLAQSRFGRLSSSRHGPGFLPAILLRELVDALAANSFVYSERIEVAAVKSFLARLVQEGQIGAGDVRAIRFGSRSFRRAREAVLEAGSVPDVASKPVSAELSIAGPAFAPAAGGADARAFGTSRRENPAIEGVFIQNAGLVLVAPFLPTLLERVGVAGDGTLKDPGMAMALMHYLACGEEGPAEFQVILPKVLCGWDIETPIDLPGTIPDVMKSESRQLLESAIAHWSVLKDTSPEALQEAFLSRAGKISLSTNNDWLLQVEQKPFDVLIEQLPWSFRLVKLSWMTRLLRTEWVG